MSVAPDRRPRALVIGLNYAPETTGIGPYTAGMSQAFAADWDVTVVTTRPHYPAWRPAPGYDGWTVQERHGSVAVRRLRHYVPRNATGSRRILSEMTFMARTLAHRHERPDAVIAVSPGLLSAGAGSLLARRWKVPFGVVVQDLYGKAVTEVGALGGPAAGYVARVEGAILAGATSVVTIHERMGEAIEAYGVEPGRLRVIPNWSHIAAPRANRGRTREQMGWGDELVVLHAGNMGAKQGLEHVIAAARRAEDRPTSAEHRFVLMGSGNQRSDLAGLAHGVPGVELIDAVPSDRFSDVLAAADVLMLHEKPGVEEMCAPSKLTSYFTAGRPVLAVASARSAGAQEVRDSGAGIVVPSGDPDALLDGVETLLRGRGGLDALGSAGLDYASARLSDTAAYSAYRRWAQELGGGASIAAQ